MISTQTPHVRPAVAELLARATEGIPLTPTEAGLLMSCEAAAIPALLLAASIIREHCKGRAVSYSRNVFIPLSNLCRDQCGYCDFLRPPGHPQARIMTPDQVLEVAEAGKRAGCKEALFSLGEKPELRYNEVKTMLARLGFSSMIDYLRAMCELVLTQTGLLPHANPGTMEAADIAKLRDVTASIGMMLETTSSRLLTRGEAHYACPDKHPRLRLKTIEAAGRLKAPFTTGILIGIGETLEERVESLFAIKELHDKYGHIQEVIVQNFRAKPDTPMAATPEPGLLDMLRTLAMARIILGGEMNIQAPPNLAPDAYQMYLFAGINDWGGVSPVTKDYINPEAPWPKLEELERVTHEAGFDLRERLAVYPEYITSDRTFLAEAVRSRVQAYAADDGFAQST